MQEKEVKEVKFEFYNEKLFEFRKNKNLSFIENEDEDEEL